MRKLFSTIMIFSLLLTIMVGCTKDDKEEAAKEQVANEKVTKKQAELYLVQLKKSYSSVYEHWDELKLDTVKLMDKPLFAQNEIELLEDGSLKVNKELIIAKGEGISTGLINEDDTNKTLNYEIDGKSFKVDRSSPNFIYNYSIHDVCVVKDGNKIIFVKQNDFKQAKNSDNSLYRGRQIIKGAIGIPYVLVVDGKRSQIGVIKVGEGEFPVPGMVDSWCYMGFPGNLTELIPDGTKLKIGNASAQGQQGITIK